MNIHNVFHCMVLGAGFCTAVTAMETYRGYTGAWIHSSRARAFVSAAPYPRVLAFIDGGHTADFHVAKLPYVGIRAWYMEPIQTELSGTPARMPGTITHREESRVQVRGDTAPRSKLQLVMDVTLTTQNVLRVTHTFVNHDTHSRRIAPWSIAVFAPTGILVVPLGDTAPVFRTVTYFPSTRHDEESFVLGDGACALLPGPVVRTGEMKIGVRAPGGWSAFVTGTSVLVMHSAFDETARYPEGGGNITMYKKRSATQRGWCESEHVTPLRIVRPGERATMEETYRFVSIPSSTPRTPDALARAVRPLVNADFKK